MLRPSPPSPLGHETVLLPTEGDFEDVLGAAESPLQIASAMKRAFLPLDSPARRSVRFAPTSNTPSPSGILASQDFVTQADPLQSSPTTPALLVGLSRSPASRQAGRARAPLKRPRSLLSLGEASRLAVLAAQPRKNTNGRKNSKKTGQPPATTAGSPRAKKTRKTLTGYSCCVSVGGVPGKSQETHKSQIEAAVRRLGGRIVGGREIGDAPREKALFLSPSYCRTAKTFLALVGGIPIVSTDWLDQCSQQHQLLDWRAFAINVPGRSCFGPQPRLLHQWVLVLEGSKAFRDSWDIVCRSAGAQIAVGVADLDRRARARIISEHPGSPISSRTARVALEKGVAVSTVDWLIGCILAGSAA